MPFRRCSYPLFLPHFSAVQPLPVAFAPPLPPLFRRCFTLALVPLLPPRCFCPFPLPAAFAASPVPPLVLRYASRYRVTMNPSAPFPDSRNAAPCGTITTAAP